MRRPLEKDVLASCLALLRLAGVFCWRNNSGAFALGEGKGRRFFRAGLVGSSDILGILAPSGKLLAVECKRPGGRVSEAQRHFLDAVTAAGGLALVIADARDLEAALRAEGVI
jgi:hypothetical protein